MSSFLDYFQPEAIHFAEEYLVGDRVRVRKQFGPLPVGTELVQVAVDSLRGVYYVYKNRQMVARYQPEIYDFNGQLVTPAEYNRREQLVEEYFNRKRAASTSTSSSQRRG